MTTEYKTVLGLATKATEATKATTTAAAYLKRRKEWLKNILIQECTECAYWTRAWNLVICCMYNFGLAYFSLELLGSFG